MITVYTLINKKLAAYNVETDDVIEARNTVQGAMSAKHRSPVLALCVNPVTPRTKGKAK